MSYVSVICYRCGYNQVSYIFLFLTLHVMWLSKFPPGGFNDIYLIL